MTSLPQPNIGQIHERADLLRELRQFFDSRGFLEVQPPCLSRDCVVDAYIDPIVVESAQFQLGMDLPPHYYLQSSPELAMKRMLAAGAPSIYSLGPVFRAGERGDRHNVEFTMLEWYELDADINAGIDLLGALAGAILGRHGFDVCTYRQVFLDALGLDPLDASVAMLQAQVAQLDVNLANTVGEDRDSLLDVLLSQVIQPTLGVDRPLIVKHYPLSQAALARQADDDEQCAARFELFVGGIELANGYDELRDADELLRRAQESNQKRAASGRRRLSVETSLMDAMRSGLPPCTGVALGVDRLLMIRSGAESVAHVMPFVVEFA